MQLLLALLSLGRAADRVVLVLPPSEVAAGWESAAALAGLTIAAREPGPRVELEDLGARWLLRARDQDGNEKTLVLAPPKTAAEREDAVWLAVSLLAATPHPPDLGAAPIARPAPITKVALPEPTRPPLAALPPPTMRPAPERVASAEPARPTNVLPLEPPPPAAPIQEVPAPATAPEPATENAEPPPAVLPEATVFPVPSISEPTLQNLNPPGPPPPFWASFGPAVVWRDQSAPTPGLDLSAGLRLGHDTWLGIGVRWLPVRDLTNAAEEARVGATDGRVTLAWAPATWTLAPLLGVGAGESRRIYTQESRSVGRIWVAQVSAETGAVWAVSPHLAVTASASVARDLNPTELDFADGTAVTPSPWQGSGGLGLKIRVP